MTKIEQMIFEEGVEQGLNLVRSQGFECGIKLGEKKLTELMQKLIHESRNEDVLKAMNDKGFRERLYQEYGINKWGFSSTRGQAHGIVDEM